MNPDTPIRVLIVDDHKVVRVGLRTVLAHAPDIEIVGDVGTAAEAIAAMQTLQPNVLLLDIRLPDASGFDVCRHAQKDHSDTQILILTSVSDDATMLQALSAGTDGYLLKEIDADALIDAIRKVASGQSAVDPVLASRALSRFRSGPEIPSLNALSAQERRVLALVAEGKTNKEIGAVMELSPKTVKNYLSHLLEKLHLSRRAEAAAFYAKQQSASGGSI